MESVNEKRDLPFFEQFYECKFPNEDEIDEQGYRQLLTTEEVQNAFVDTKIITDELMRLGEDIAGGGDFNTFILRQDKFAWIESSNRSNDTMTNVTETIRISDAYPQLHKGSVYVDDTGIGHGVSDRLNELGYQVNKVIAGGVAKNSKNFKNVKAQSYWNLRLWIKSGGKLFKDDRWFQLTWIKYKINSDKVLQIEPKKDLKKRTGKSPDFAEGLMQTFFDLSTSISFTSLDKPVSVAMAPKVTYNQLSDEERKKQELQADIKLMKQNAQR